MSKPRTHLYNGMNIYEQWEGDFLVRYRVMQEYRYTAVIHTEKDGDITLSGEWRPEEGHAVHSLVSAIWTYECGWYRDDPRDTTCETRTTTVEIGRWHKSKIILAPGHFGHAENRNVPYGGWDLH